MNNDKNYKNDMHIFFASDNHFIMPLTNAISSILRNALKEDFHHFYILDSNISDKNKQKLEALKNIKDFQIEFIKMDNDLFEKCPLMQCCNHIPIQTYYRYLIPVIKPELDKVLYLDCDILVESSLESLWNTNLKNTYCAVVEDMYNKTFDDAARLNLNGYFNAGVLLLNNKKLAEEHFSDILFTNTQKLFDERNLVWQDQDVLNYSFKNNVTWINPCYNYQQNFHKKYTTTKYTGEDLHYAAANIVILHYNSTHKPWNLDSFNFFKFRYVHEMILNHFYIEALSSLFSIKMFLQSVLSIKNSGNRHIVISVLGLKLKIKKRKKYKHIVLLGENCELGFQYVKNCGDIDSGVFDWCYVFNKENLLNALDEPEIITSEDLEVVAEYAMAKDFRSGCAFHFKRKAEDLLNKNNSLNIEVINQEKNDLKSRNLYLTKKLQNIYKTYDTKLFIYKAQQLNDENIKDYTKFLQKLNIILESKTSNFAILFIVRKDFYNFFKEYFSRYQHIYIRKVEHFTEIGDAVNPQKTDNKNWRKIFEEFSPVSSSKRKKVYKFEKNKLEV